MSYDKHAVLNRDNRLCRFRFTGCRQHATRTELAVPEFLGGATTNTNARSACGACAKKLRHQRNRAARLFNYHEGWW